MAVLDDHRTPGKALTGPQLGAKLQPEKHNDRVVL